jgi:hypothetical protein
MIYVPNVHKERGLYFKTCKGRAALPPLTVSRLSYFVVKHIIFDCDDPWGFAAREIIHVEYINLLKPTGYVTH